MDRFKIIVEVVPPASPDAEPLLTALESLASLSIAAFSVASNPVAKPRMSALALSTRIQERTDRPAILHCTTRDHNRLSLQGLLWGAQALGIGTVLVTTGDFVALGDRAVTTTVRDVNVFELVRMARKETLRAGVVFAPPQGRDKLNAALDRLARKVEAGAQFAITQPRYERSSAEALARAVEQVGIPIFMGILPLHSARHAEFLHQQVEGITVPEAVRRRISQASDAVAAGVDNARDMLQVARERFAGACLMPPFGRYEVLLDIVKDNASPPSIDNAGHGVNARHLRQDPLPGDLG